MTLSLIVAMTPDGVIGREGGLPWRLSRDLKRFKQLTMGHAIVMGRRTWESIGRPLPSRVSIVITRQADYRIEHADVHVTQSIDEAIALAAIIGGIDHKELFVIGGGEIYRQALPRADRLYITRVLADIEGDTTFPPVDWSQWRLESSEEFRADERNDHATQFEIYGRIRS